MYHSSSKSGSTQPLISPLFRESCDRYCDRFHGPRKDDWWHCFECRNRTAKWQSSITYRYLRNHEDRPILAATLNVKRSDGNHLDQDELEAIVSKFKNHFNNHLRHGGYQLVLDDSPSSSRPHWHGLFLGVVADDLVVAWHRATTGNQYEAWVQPDEIETTLNQTINYAFKVWGSQRNGQAVRVPVKGTKVLSMFNFFRNATKGQLEAELSSLKPSDKPTASRWEPDEEQMLDRWITRPTWEDIGKFKLGRRHDQAVV
jgi:hypothetical protein